MPTVKQYQNDPRAEYLKKVAYAESGNNPKAKNPYGSAGGSYQFVTGTWNALNKKYKLGYTEEDRFNPEKADKVMRLFTQDNENILKVIKPDINDADRYMAHFLGAGGASKFFSVYNQNPDAPISTVMSPAALAANKNVAYNKNGSQKTVADVYAWANKKMSLTPETVTQDFTNYEKPTPIPNFAQSNDNLQSLPETAESAPKVEEAKNSLQQQTNEYNFVQDLNSFQQRPTQEITQEEQQIQQPQTNFLDQYAQIVQFVENPLMQDGGTYQKDKQWLNDWYSQRQINNPEFNNSRRDILASTNQIPPPTITNLIAGNSQVKGGYNKTTGEILLTPDAQPYIYTHEGVHKAQEGFSPELQKLHTELVNRNINPKEGLPKDYQDNYDYLKDPNEVNSRLQVLRREAGITPTQEVTPQFIESFLENYNFKNTNVNELLELFDDDGLRDILNNMASNDSQNNNFQRGGTITVSSKNDPRYRAYQDSLYAYNLTKKTVSDIKKQGYDEFLKGYQTAEQSAALQNKNIKLKPIGAYFGNGEPVSEYKKPERQVLLDNTPQVRALNIQTQPINLGNQDFSTELRNSYPAARIPKYFNVTDKGNGSFGADWERSYRYYPQEGQTLSTISPDNSRKIVPYYQQGGVIEDNMGQWKYPMQTTKINSGEITMQGVNYPVLGVDNLGNHKLMFPNQEYKFAGTSVTEYPVPNLNKFFS